MPLYRRFPYVVAAHLVKVPLIAYMYIYRYSAGNYFRSYYAIFRKLVVTIVLLGSTTIHDFSYRGNVSLAASSSSLQDALLYVLP